MKFSILPSVYVSAQIPVEITRDVSLRKQSCAYLWSGYGLITLRSQIGTNGNVPVLPVSFASKKATFIWFGLRVKTEKKAGHFKWNLPCN